MTAGAAFSHNELRAPLQAHRDGPAIGGSLDGKTDAAGAVQPTDIRVATPALTGTGITPAGRTTAEGHTRAAALES